MNSVERVMAAFGLIAIYAGWLVFREVSRWNLIFLLGLTFLVGFNVRGTLGLSSGAKSVLIAAGALFLAVVSGRAFSVGFVLFGRLLWGGSLLYWLGLLFISWFGLEPLLRDLWLGGGFVLFTGMAASWFARLDAEVINRAYVPLAADLYFLALNLWLAARLLVAG
ncbi:MAG: hypothetical protein ACK2T2_10850 [Anaerolineales bacterium]